MPDAKDAAMHALAGRIDDLEMRLTYQDDVIERLNEVIVGQWGKLDQMQGQIVRLESQLREVQTSTGADVRDEPPPPHY